MIGLVAALLAQACSSDECSVGEKRCNGNRVEFCAGDPGCGEVLFGSCTVSWHHIDTCGAPGSGSVVAPTPPVCVEVQPTSDSSVMFADAFCAPSSDPDPKCEGRSGFCDTDTAVACKEGFAMRTTPCAAPKVCSGNGDCRDPRCFPGDGHGNGTLCDGTTLLACIAGHSTDTVCPGACVTADGNTFCALSAKPDPLCGTADSHCDGNVLVICAHGFATSREPCLGASKCLPNASRCE